MRSLHRGGSRVGAKGQAPLLRAGGPGSQGAKGLLGPPRRAAAGGMLRRKKCFGESRAFRCC